MIPGTLVLQQQNPLTGLLLTLGLAALAVVVVALVIGLRFWFVWHRQRDEGLRWAQAAQALGLTPGAPTHAVLSSTVDGTSTARPMTGTWGGREAAIWVSRTRYPSRTTGWRRYALHTCCSVGTGARGPAFSIVPRNPLDGVLAGSGRATGLASFDERFRVTGPSAADVVARLIARGPDGISPAERFVEFSHSGWSLAADQDAVVARRPGVVVDARQLRTALDVLSDLAARMER